MIREAIEEEFNRQVRFLRENERLEIKWDKGSPCTFWTQIEAVVFEGDSPQIKRVSRVFKADSISATADMQSAFGEEIRRMVYDIRAENTPRVQGKKEMNDE